MTSRAALWSGSAFALAAGAMWGLVFIAPVLLAEYPALMLSAARYLAFGLIALPLAWWDRTALRGLSREDWVEALKLSAVGNLAYYGFLAAAIQRAGGPLPTVIIGTLPVVIAIASNLGERNEARLPWRRLAPSLGLLAAGIALVNHEELARLGTGEGALADPARYATGAALAVAAVACWTWYPIRNARWLRAHPGRSPRAWATAQGLATLPLAAVGFAAFWAWSAASGQPLAMPLGPQPERFLVLMFAIGLFGSWLGTLCWNEASQRLPPSLAGQLIVFETLAALTSAWLLRGLGPGVAAGVGVGLLVAGVWWALRPGSSGGRGASG